MSGSAHFQLSGNAAEYYEQFAVKYILGPWAPRLVKAANIQPDDRVLDVACGTGVVTRAAALALGPNGTVTGLDLNSGMLEVAKSRGITGAGTLSWVQSSALDMDLPDESFDVVLCQQGLQYFPDQSKALQETHRVLRAGGRALFNIWAGAGPYNKALGDAVAKHIDEATGNRFREIRNVPGVDTLRALFSDAGFEQVGVTREQIEFRLPEIRAFVLAHLQGTPFAAAVKALPDAEQSALANDVAEWLSQYADGIDVVVPEFCHFVSSKK